MKRTSELLNIMVLDQPKAHEGMQKHAVRRDVFVTLDSGRQGSNTAVVPLRGAGWNGVICNPMKNAQGPCQ
jgi:hypothetical protein